jgi:hypothetical protein
MHPPTRPAQPPPVEPGGLSEREAAIFRDLVASSDVAHFAPSDVPLLALYVQCLAQGERAIAALREQGDVVGGKMNAWNIVLEKSVRAATALSARLRLAPQSRYERAKLPKKLDWMTRRSWQQEADDD